MKYVEVICHACGKSILKSSHRYKQRIKIGKTEFYCNRSCGQHKKKLKLEGQRFGRLVVESFVEFRDRAGFWRCKCDCGNETIARGFDLVQDKTHSCGCIHKETVTKHGLGGSKIYSIWQNMMDRCYNPEHQAYHNYGGRGITVSQEWHDVTNFARDMGTPKRGMSLDRINNNNGYSKDNCRWATRREQGRNVRNNHHITCNGETKTMAEWAESTGIPVSTISKRVQYGYTGADLFYRGKHQQDKTIAYLTLQELRKEKKNAANKKRSER